MKDDLERILDDRPTFTLRKVLYIVGVAVLVIIILCIGLVVGLSKHPNYHDRPTVVDKIIKTTTLKTTTSSTAKPTKAGNEEKFYICKSANCYTAAARVKSMLSDEVTPCSNFYKWACGGWLNKVFISNNEYRKNRLNMLYKQHMHDLARTLSSPVVDEKNWYEKHVKNIFQSCMDMYSREKEGAAQLKPYIKKVLNSTYLLDSDFNDKKKNMDLSHAIYMAHKELNVDVFLHIELTYDYWKKKNIVNIQKPSTPGYMMYYNDRTKLRTYIMNLAKTFLEDIGIKVDSAMDSKLRTFSFDAVYIEWYIEWAGDRSYNNYYWYGSPSLKKIKDKSDLKLKSQQLDIIRILKEYYPRAEPIADYEVRADLDYLRDLDEQLQHFDRYIQYWARDMNNFIFWRILFKMSPFLSSKYKVKHTEYVKNSYSGGYYIDNQSHTMECVSYLKWFVPEALVQWDIDAGEHSSQTFSQIDKILQNSFNGLRTYFTRSKSFMADQVTEDNMRKKKIDISLGKSDDLWQAFKIKNMYQTKLYTDPKNFIGNIVNCSELRAHAESDALRSGNDKPVYMRHFFHEYGGPHTLSNEIFIPMSFLKQPNQYIRNGPPALNLGSLGYLTLWEALDIAGLANDVRYSYSNDRRLLSLESFDRFKNLTRCIKQRNLEGKIFHTINVDGIEKRVEFGYGYSNDAWMHEAAEPVAENIIIFRSLIYGLKNYRKQNSHAMDVKLPGMNFTGNQFVFLSSVQSMCEKVNPNDLDYHMKYAMFLPIDDEINVALQQIPEFADAFQCKVGDKMRPNANCASLT